ncbi:SRPBCC family protein [Natrononativus amylolyticus]|uniref:SRPBCC family protein n=1 Tax=Natrononativus amylolyticus TaxID=2963434 RepID=UPI0020CE0473|nr:SRPBCC family protein [Natrononativus amylolyticus]
MTRVRTAYTRNGWRLEVSHVVSAPADEAWELLCDTHRWVEWSPTITGVDSTGRRLEADTAGTLRTVGGLRLPFRITEYDPERRRWSWAVARVPSTGHRIDDLGADRCRVAFELSPLAAGYVPVCLRGLERFAALLGDETA